MKVATVASNTAWKDVKKNVESTELHVVEVLSLFPDTDIILFPELSLSGFVVDSSNSEIAQPLDGAEVRRIQEIARKHNVALICGIIEKNGNDKPFNTQFVVSKDGSLLTSYHKNHLFTQSAEPDVYSPGEQLAIFEFESCRCGLSTCFDIRFPRLFEAYKKAGAQIIFSGFNWVNGRNKVDIMQSLVKSRATENQFFMVAVDRSGSDPNTNFYGVSVIANPYSEDIAERREIYSYAEIKLDEIAAISKQLPLDGSFRTGYKIKESI